MSQFFRTLLGQASGPGTLPVSGAALWLPPGFGQFTDLGATPVAADGDHTEQWNDRSGNAYNAVQVVDNLVGAPRRSFYRPGITNRGKSVLGFEDGSGEHYQFTLPNALGVALNAAGAGEMFVVLKNLTANAIGKRGSWTLGTAGSSFLLWEDSNIYEGFGTNARKDGIAPGIDLSAAFFVYNVYSAANDYKIFVNGVQRYTSAVNTVAFPNSGLIFGYDSSGFGGLHADVSEVIIFPGKLSNADRTTMTNYCT